MEGLLVLIAIFNYSFGVILSYLTGWNQSTVLRTVAVLMLLFSVYEYQSAVSRKRLTRKSSRVFNRMLILYIAILVGMGITVRLNGYVSPMMKTYLLSFGTRALAGVFLGCAVINKNILPKVEKWIVPFCALYTASLYPVVLRNTGGSLFSYEVNRQSLSYAGAYAFSMLLFYNANYESIEKFRLLRGKRTLLLNYIMMVIDIYIVFAGGGRGAFVLAFVEYIFYLRILFFSDRRHFSLGIVFLLIGVIAIFSVSVLGSTYSGISAGYGYVLNTFANGFTDRSSQERIVLWTRAFENAKNSLFLGCGAGSTAYNVGFYAHNVYVDILTEYGILGVTLFAVICGRVVRKAIKLRAYDSRIQFMLTVFLCSFIMLLFSGSWYSEAGLWIAVTAVLGIETGGINDG